MTQADGPDPTDPDVAERLRGILTELMLIPGLSGDEGRVAAAIRRMLQAAGLLVETDVFGNLWTTIEGDPDRPSVMIFAHMDQLGFVVRKVEETGFLRLERVGGVPERALAAQAVTVCARTGDLPGVIANKSHHATQADEKYHVVRYRDIYVDAGFTSAADARSAGVDIGTPVVYAPRVMSLGPTRVAGTSVDDRAGCAVLVDVARDVVRRYVAGGADPQNRPTLHVAFTTQEEFNLRGALPLANRLQPAIAIQIDLMLASDTPDAE
ncbi:MAG: M42 family peptidase, partial [Pseudomonadota bacterium]